MYFENICAIMACDPTGIMGKEGKIPWYCPEDLEHFSKTTRHHIIVMGHRTFLSLPKSYFNERIGVVISREKQVNKEGSNVIFINSLNAFMSLNQLPKDKKCYLIGGAQICKFFFEKNLIKELLLTKFKHNYEGDIFFPLSHICTWPCQKVQESEVFTIYHYFNPVEVFPCK